MKKVFSVVALLFLFGNMQAQAQFFKNIFINRYDKNNLHHGKWKYKEYINNKRSLMSIGRFDHGKQVGNWKYFYQSGNVRMTEHYTWHGDKRLVDITYYHENGQISNIGTAWIEDLEDKIHYYWTGDWKYFEKDGTPIKTVSYANGQAVKTIYTDGRIEVEVFDMPKHTLDLPIRKQN
ncbi:toxin-antitoxin system YwqK family antitoxin [Adhaeribacter aquaticus]|uniref:toxin-antitoxin system YwqK family antitoxin n=1 Tax=Adhaeribacter aquaticus TaxID=299567 RepID=UPI00042497D0|nr:hypothetical protein [Adhaeribacter aquaticus]